MENRDDSLVGLVPPELPVAPWQNAQPLQLQRLTANGWVTLVVFWSATCPNSRNVLPTISKWWDIYHNLGLMVVGIHSPFFPFEKSRTHFEQSTEQLALSWPTLHDEKQNAQKAFDNLYTPRFLVLKPKSGVIVHDHIGDTGYDLVEQAIRHELAKRGHQNLPPAVSTPHRHRLGSFCAPSSPLTYLNRLSVHTDQDGLPTNTPGVTARGDWEFIGNGIRPASIKQRNSLDVVFMGTGIGLIIEPANRPITINLTLDNRAIPKNLRGNSVSEDEQGNTVAFIQAPGLYDLISGSQFLHGVTLGITPTKPATLHALTFTGCPLSTSSGR